MKVLTQEEVDALPEYATQANWTRILWCSRATLRQWEDQGRLVGSRQMGVTIYTRANILKALGIKQPKARAK
jgi:hypothetical protein